MLATNRGHWAIENSCHYVIDWNFNEDRSRIRARHGPENVTRLRRFAVGVIKPRNRSWTRPSGPLWARLGRREQNLGSEPKFAEPTARPEGAVRCTAAKLVSDPNFCKAEQQPQTWPQRLNRVRSAVTQKVNAVVAPKISVHAALPADASGQLRFLGYKLHLWQDQRRRKNAPAAPKHASCLSLSAYDEERHTNFWACVGLEQIHRVTFICSMSAQSPNVPF